MFHCLNVYCSFRYTVWVWGFLLCLRSTSAPSYPTTKPSMAWQINWPGEARTDRHDTLQTDKRDTPWRGGGANRPQAATRQGRGSDAITICYLFISLKLKTILTFLLFAAQRGKDVYHPGWRRRGSPPRLLLGPLPCGRASPRNSHLSCSTAKRKRRLQDARAAPLDTTGTRLLRRRTLRTTHQMQEVKLLNQASDWRC